MSKVIPFDIALRSEIQSEENKYQGRYKVQTRGGNPVRIICWDKKDSEFPIVTLVEEYTSHDVSISFRNDGRVWPDGSDSCDDLCLIDTYEPKFKVGDTIRYKGNNSIRKIIKLNDIPYSYSTVDPLDSTPYDTSHWYYISYKYQDLYELVSKEPELTDFEKELANYLYKSIGVGCMDGIDSLAKELAPKLIEIAKKEIIEKLKEK